MEIVKVPAAILKKKLQPVGPSELKTEALRNLAEQMRETMIKANGIGLAANQVGKDLQLFVIEKELAKENKLPDVFLNPEITEYSRETDDMEEGCLSIPEYYVPVRRSKKIKFKALGLNGEKLKFKARGILARVLQHETDHLNGLTIKNRVKKK